MLHINDSPIPPAVRFPPIKIDLKITAKALILFKDRLFLLQVMLACAATTASICGNN